MNTEQAAPHELSPRAKDSSKLSLDKTAPKSPVSNSKAQNRSPVSQSKAQAIPTTSTTLNVVAVQDGLLSQEQGDVELQPTASDLENGQKPGESVEKTEEVNLNSEQTLKHHETSNGVSDNDNKTETLPKEQNDSLTEQDSRAPKEDVVLEEAGKEEVLVKKSDPLDSQTSSKQKQSSSQLDNENDVAKKEEKIEDRQISSKQSSGQKTPNSPTKGLAVEETTLIKSEGKKIVECEEMDKEAESQYQAKRINV